MQSISIKQGDTFGFSAAITNNEGVAVTGIAANLKCQIRDACKVLVDDMTITESDSIAGTYLFYAGSTAQWSNVLSFDIQYTDNSNQVASTETVIIMVTEDVTAA